jgi:hypothetical protein
MMKRIDIHYGGQIYSVGGRELHEVEKEITDGIASGSHWMLVNDGEGQRLDAHLLLMPGSPIALIPIPDQWENPEDEVA